MKVKITDGTIKKLQKRLLKVVKEEYGADGIYLDVDKVEITQIEDYMIDYTIRFGREADGKSRAFQKTIKFMAGDGNLDFLAGQFFQCILHSEEE